MNRILEFNLKLIEQTACKTDFKSHFRVSFKASLACALKSLFWHGGHKLWSQPKVTSDDVDAVEKLIKKLIEQFGTVSLCASPEMRTNCSKNIF